MNNLSSHLNQSLLKLSSFTKLFTLDTLQLFKQEPSRENPIYKRLHGLCINDRWDEVQEMLVLHSQLPRKLQKDIVQMVLNEAAPAGELDMVRFLLTSPQLKVHPNVNGNGYHAHAPLYSSCVHNQLEVVKYLMEHPRIELPLNFKEGQRDFGFSTACMQGHTEMVSHMLSHPRLAYAKSMLCAKAVELALEEEQHELLRYLVMDYKLVVTPELEPLFEQSEALRSLFEKRQFNQKLQQELPANTVEPRKARHKL